MTGNLLNELGNIHKKGIATRFSDLEIIALSITSEETEIDNESLLFTKLHKSDV